MGGGDDGAGMVGDDPRVDAPGRKGPGQRPKSDRLAPKVLALVAQGGSYRLIRHEVGLSKNTVADIVKRSRPSPGRPAASPAVPVRPA